MVWQASIVVRVKDGIYMAGFASEIPKRSGWEDVADFGSWFGSQMSYRPFRCALSDAHELAESLNAKARSK